jgi:hypothetical protein
MTVIRFYGASDDLIEVEGCPGADEFNSYEKRYMWHGDLIAPGGRESMRIHAIYDGCWAFAIGQTGESVPLPDWPVHFTQSYRGDGTPGYSAVLDVEAPEGTRLDNVWPKREDDDG